MERDPDEKPSGLGTGPELRREPDGFETGPELRHDETIPPPATTLPDAPRSNRRIWAAVLAVLVVGLLVYLLLTLL